jgi:hypothetical protein
MAGKTAIDTDLRNEVLAFLGGLEASIIGVEHTQVAKDLYARLQPLRVRVRKVVTEAETAFTGEAATVVDTKSTV